LKDVGKDAIITTNRPSVVGWGKSGRWFSLYLRKHGPSF